MQHATVSNPCIHSHGQGAWAHMLHMIGLAKQQCRPNVSPLNIGIEDTCHALNALLPSCRGIAQGATYKKAIAGGCQEVHAGIIHHPKALMRDLDLMTASPQRHCLKAYTPSHRASTICNLKWICCGLQGSKSRHWLRKLKSGYHSNKAPDGAYRLSAMAWDQLRARRWDVHLNHKDWRQMRWGLWASH